MEHSKHEAELKSFIKGDVNFDPLHRSLFSTAACIFRIFPLGVVAPKSTQDVLNLIRYAINHQIPVTPRAGGSSLSGQAVGNGIIIDFKKYMCNILELNLNESWVRVEPGLIYSHLNSYLKPYGYFFPPDPSSGNFCCLGGMIGNNGAGPHTLKYGSTKDHIVSLNMVTGTGHELKIKPMDLTQEGASYSSREEESLYHGVWNLLNPYKSKLDTVKTRYNKNSCGYNVREVFRDGIFDLTRLIAGSEGTLGALTEVTLKIQPVPKAKSSCLLYFSSWGALSEAVSKTVELGASAAEVMDKTFLALVRTGAPHMTHLWPAEAEAVLLLEFEGDSEKEAEERINHAVSLIVEKANLCSGAKYAQSLSEQEELWELRKAAYPLLYKADNYKKPMNFIDDAALPLDQLNAYLDGLRKLFEKYDVEAVIYGHAGNGNLHVNPLMDPRDPKFEETLLVLADTGFELAMELGGTITGEHGDGILRAPYVKHQYQESYGLFKEIKSFFDPKRILNPGKIIGEDLKLPVKHLRYKFNYQQTRTVFDTAAIQTELEKCHGCGTCRNYCPVAQHIPMEEATARAKANLLMASLKGDIPIGDLSADYAKDTADLCYNCKRCLTHCPTSVDIPKLATKLKELYVETHGQNFTNWLLGNSRTLFALSSYFSPLINFLLKNSIVRQVMEWLTGIDKRRILPKFHRPVKLTKNYAPNQDNKINNKDATNNINKDNTDINHTDTDNINIDDINKGKNILKKSKVIYFPGCFANYVDPIMEGRATIHVLEANGFEVIVPEKHTSGNGKNLLCCGIGKMSLGSGKEVINAIRHNVEILAPLTLKGYPIITSSPSCGLALKKEWYEYLPEPRVKKVASRTYDILEFLIILNQKGELNTKFKKLDLTIAYHNPCHLSAQGISREAISLLKEIPGIIIKEIEDGCSGMGGTFGMKKKNFELSMEIGEHLFNQINKAEIPNVVTGCGSCNLQIQQGTNTKVLHPAYILAQAYGFKDIIK